MWLADSPSGVYRDHALQSKIQMDAYADAVVLPFLRTEPNYGRKRGQSVTITRMGKLSRAGTVSDQDRLPVVRPAVTTHAVTVKEWGNKMELTEFETDLTHFELEASLKENLREQISITMDFMAATALKTTLVKYVPTVAAQTFTTNGTPSGTADRNLNVSDVEVIRDYMRQTLKAPPYGDGRYAAIVSTRAARGIKRDPTYQQRMDYRQPKAFIKSYVFSFEDVDFYETNNDEAIDDSPGASQTVLGEAIFCGGDPGFTAIIRDPELRVSPKVIDLGRIWEIGWVGTIEAGLSYVLASNSRVVHVTST